MTKTIGNSAKITAPTPTTWRQPISDIHRRRGIRRRAGRARARQWWSSSGPLLPGSVDVFEDAGDSELDRGQDTGEHEQAHRDRGGEAEIGPGATEGDAIDPRDQDVRAASGVLTGGEGDAVGEQRDRGAGV